MDKIQALKALGAATGGVAASSAALAHVAWHRGYRRTGVSLLAAGAAVDCVLLASTLVPNFPLFGKPFSRGSRNGSSIALTFDDGPRTPYTGMVLDVLRHESVAATFFVLGENAGRHPDLVRRMESEGHRVANHGMDHSILMWSGAAEASQQVERADEALRRAGVLDPAPLFRAPHGWLSPAAHRAISSLGYRVTGWTKGVWDSANPGTEKIVSRVGAVLAPGAIILLHDGWHGDHREERSQTAAAVSRIINMARQRGLRFITVEQMIREKEGVS